MGTSSVHILKLFKSGPLEAGGWGLGGGGVRRPNNFVKFVDFVSEKAVMAKVVGMKIQTCIYSRNLPVSLSINNKCNIFRCHRVPAGGNQTL